MRGSTRTVWVARVVAAWAGMAVVLAAGLVSGLGAEPVGAPAGSDALVQLAQQAKQQFRPLTEAHATAARAQLLAAIQRLDSFLQGGPKKNETGWKKYLVWDQMTGAVADAAAVDRAALQDVAQRFFRNEPGLELEQFTAVRDALVAYLYAVTNVADADLESHYQQRLDQLIALLPEYAAQPTAEARRQIGQILGWLKRADQAEQLVIAVQKQYQQPNLFASISERLAASGFQSEVQKQSDVRDVILGTSITGQASLTGNLDLELLDDADGASLRLQLNGTVLSDNVGYNRGVTICSHGTTSVMAWKPLLVTAGGISSSAAAAHCCTATTITGICAQSCLVQRMARKRVARSKGQAESIASRRAEGRIATQMDAEAAELLAKAQDTYQSKFRGVLLRRGEFPKQLSFQTQAKRLLVTWQQANSAQLGAPSPPPALDGDPDLAVRLHESFVANFSRALIGGFTLTDERLVRILTDASAQVPDELKIQPDNPPWSITFSSTAPVSAQFEDNRIRFAIRGRKFTSGTQTVGGPEEPNMEMELSAVYQLEKTPTGAHLTRQGDVEVTYLGAKDTLSPKQVAIRAVMKRKFEAVFAEEFLTDGIKLPGRWQQGGKLQLQQMASQAGWLRLGWLKNTAPPPVSVARRD